MNAQAQAFPQPRPIGSTASGASPQAREAAAAAPTIDRSRTQLGLAWEAFRAHRMAFVGLCTVASMAVACVALPFVLPWSATDIDLELLAATGPSAAHPLGTDSIGRDVLARLVSAGRISLLIGLMVAIISTSIGATVGLVAGYFGGKVEGLLMWWVNVLLTIPTLPLLIALGALVANPDSKLGGVFGALPEEWRIIVVMSSLGWMSVSRMVRSQVITLKNQEFVEAALAQGSSHTRIMFLHILPNSVSVIAVFSTLAVSGAIIGESTLSFLGVGVNPPTATWGNMLSEARDLFTVLQYWWLTWFPAVAILVTVLCVNFIGDGVRDALDPKAKR